MAQLLLCLNTDCCKYLFLQPCGLDVQYIQILHKVNGSNLLVKQHLSKGNIWMLEALIYQIRVLKHIKCSFMNQEPCRVIRAQYLKSRLVL
jgi:hypothetical protein